jgi:hypothetical protein
VLARRRLRIFEPELALVRIAALGIQPQLRVLLLPSLAGVCGLEDGAFLANHPAGLAVGREVDAVERLLGVQIGL